jgi:hypothetical protein
MPSSNCLRWVIICATGILLAACDDAPTPATPPQAAGAPNIPKPASENLPPEMVAAVSSARNASIVSVHFGLKGAPTVNKALPVDIAIIPHGNITSLTVHFEAHDGLAVVSGNQLDRRSDPQPEKIIKHQLVLLPGREGVFVVSAIVEIESSEQTTSRIFSIPLIVAPSVETPTNSAPVSSAQ